MKEHSERAVKPEHEYLKSLLEKMTDQYAKTVEKVTEFGDNEYMDYQSRRLVEMAGNIIIGYLVLEDAARDAQYTNGADMFIRKGRAENRQC